ncbi:hypothetical protein HHK36_006909 [Tetracentron sinense]|uniref:Pre-mRNA-splicing factor Syf1/CRNKL1-like C-terminal HAT-repeats domain-containing protein n=1 Tax=Tetracentron sinense TaxID=13715 RepID=A0A835DL70_TETSI|nr:hypothetical protein HHK36_006909 [Tetracentron sinense]
MCTRLILEDQSWRLRKIKTSRYGFQQESRTRTAHWFRLQRSKSSENITDPTELADYRLRQRTEFEDLIRRFRSSVWITYGEWEESQDDLNRARSVWERALEVDHRNHTSWLKFAEQEMKNKFIDRARNVWDRAVTILPHVDQIWYKYIEVEEMGAREIFEGWMKLMPDQQCWLSYIEFDLRYNEIKMARKVFDRFVQCHSKVGAYAEFEMKNGEMNRARKCYETAIDKLCDDEKAAQLFAADAELEEIGRARAIYECALGFIPKGRLEDLYRKFEAFEHKYQNVDMEGIDEWV